MLNPISPVRTKAKTEAMNGEINVRKSAPLEAMPDQDQKNAVKRIISQPRNARKRKNT
jgi:hypothetical protein